jgi:hypothetical protein
MSAEEQRTEAELTECLDRLDQDKESRVSKAIGLLTFRRTRRRNHLKKTVESRRTDTILDLYDDPFQSVSIPWPHPEDHLDYLVRTESPHVLEKGVFHWLGTLGGKHGWVNPCGIDWLGIKADRSSDGYGRAECLLETKFPLDGWTLDTPNSYYEVDLGVGRSARVDYYTLRHGSRTKDNHALSWRLMCTNDGWEKGAHARKWDNLHITFGETLLQRTNDRYGEYGVGTWKVMSRWDKQEHPYYRYFRVEQLANNHAGDHILALSGLELYGDLRMDMDWFAHRTRKHLAACTIQRIVRQMLSKDIFANTRRRFRERGRAAKKIQKFVRTVNQRLSTRMKRLRTFIQQMRLDSAILIQQWIRRQWSQHVATRMLFIALRKNRAALVIQNNFRAYLAFVEMHAVKFAFMRIVAERKRLDELKEFRRKALVEKREKQMTAWHTLNSSATTLQRAVRQLKARKQGKALLTEKKASVDCDHVAIAAEASLRASSHFHRGRADRLAFMMEEEDAIATAEEEWGDGVFVDEGEDEHEHEHEHEQEHEDLAAILPERADKRDPLSATV